MTYQGRVNRYQRAIRRATHAELKRTGTLVRFTPARRCACLDYSQQPQPDCRVCGGRGWFYVEAEEMALRAAVHDASLNRLWQGYGFVQQGDLAVTFDQLVFVKPFDRLRLTMDDLRQFSLLAEQEVLVHDPDDSGATEDALRHRAVEVLVVVRTDAHTGEIVRYRAGVDYLAPTLDNRIIWQSGPGVETPPPLSSISVAYLADYDWVALQDVPPRHAGGGALGAPAFFSRHITDERATELRLDDVVLT